MSPPIRVRPFTRTDTPSLLALMEGLAVFEDYAGAFRVTEQDLIAHGLGDKPRFGAFVAHDGGERLLGMAAHYVVPWTYDMSPRLVLKELFVADRERGRGVGAALMRAVLAEARRIGAQQIDWLVLADNEAAKSFYKKVGGRMDAKWQRWSLSLDGNDTHGNLDG